MALHFPDKPEIPLANPPLAEVVCQVRYPPILRIAKEKPSELQERIRHRFPGFGVEQPFKLQIPGLGSVGEPSAELPPRLFRFKSIDEQTTASLAVDFCALSTNNYLHWLDFVDDLMVLHEAVVAIYQPAYATRIGLRYVNRFDRTNTGLDGMHDILALIRPELTSMLRSNGWSDPEEWLSQLVLADGDAKLTIRTALDSEDGESFLLLDFDYYELGKMELAGVKEHINRYHKVIYRAFRWCLLDKSLAVFGSEPTKTSKHDN